MSLVYVLCKVVLKVRVCGCLTNSLYISQRGHVKYIYGVLLGVYG